MSRADKIHSIFLQLQFEQSGETHKAKSGELRFYPTEEQLWKIAETQYTSNELVSFEI